MKTHEMFLLILAIVVTPHMPESTQKVLALLSVVCFFYFFIKDE